MLFLPGYCDERKSGFGNEMNKVFLLGLLYYLGFKHFFFMNKVIVLYKHPQDVEAFEKYYNETHLPLVPKIPNLDHAEFTKFGPGPDGSEGAYYRMAELYFASDASMLEALGSDEGKAAAGDIPNFATGGFEFLFGKI